MSRYSRLASDEEHLPDGFERVGYDADTQQYTFRDTRDGSLWQGPEGAEYGSLHRIGQSSVTNEEYNQDVQETWIAHDKRETCRMFAPFLLLIALFLMLIWWIISPTSVVALQCKGESQRYVVTKGDTCWDIASKAHMDLKDLQQWNPTLDCDRLVPEQQICVPPTKNA